MIENYEIVPFLVLSAFVSANILVATMFFNMYSEIEKEIE